MRLFVFSLTILLLSALPIWAPAEPISYAELHAKLQAQSPCLLAGRSEKGTDSVVFCIVGRNEKGSESCELTGYDVAKDVFISNAKLRTAVRGACENGGLEALLKSRVRGKAIRDILLRGFTLEFAGNDKLLKAYYDNNEAKIENFNERQEGGGLRKRKGENLQSSLAGAEEEAPVAAGGGGPQAKDGPEGRNGRDASLPAAAPAPPSFVTVKVFYASDRQTTVGMYPSQAFNDERNTTGSLQYGIAEVSIPPIHQKGALEEASVFTFERTDIPQKHIMILRVINTPADEFFSDVRKQVSSSQKREAFVFVHGYNNSFSDSIRRTAQLAFDLNFDGAAIAYTWPSGDAVWKYSVAEGNAEWTFRHLKKFLEEVARSTGAERIHLIAHSMGNRVLANALYNMAPSPQRLFQQIILAAPDIDTDTFSELEEKIAGSAARVTVYASKNDQALNSSKKFHAYRRLGQSGDDVFTSKLIDTVDISLADDSSVGHSYYGDNPQVLSDLGLILKRDEAPNQRPGLLQKSLNQSFYWQMQRAAAASAKP